VQLTYGKTARGASSPRWCKTTYAQNPQTRITCNCAKAKGVIRHGQLSLSGVMSSLSRAIINHLSEKYQQRYDTTLRDAQEPRLHPPCWDSCAEFVGWFSSHVLHLSSLSIRCAGGFVGQDCSGIRAIKRRSGGSAVFQCLPIVGGDEQLRWRPWHRLPQCLF
jgi:hypothetical protein